MSSTSEFTLLHACIFNGKSCISRSTVSELDSTSLKPTLLSFLRKMFFSQFASVFGRKSFGSVAFRDFTM